MVPPDSPAPNRSARAVGAFIVGPFVAPVIAGLLIVAIGILVRLWEWAL